MYAVFELDEEESQDDFIPVFENWFLCADGVDLKQNWAYSEFGLKWVAATMIDRHSDLRALPMGCGRFGRRTNFLANAPPTAPLAGRRCAKFGHAYFTARKTATPPSFGRRFRAGRPARARRGRAA